MTSADVVPALLDVCPSAEPLWKAHLSEWKDEFPGSFLNVSVFAQHIVRSYREGRTEEFSDFFLVVERMIQEGDADVVGLATVGILEDLQVLSSHEQFGSAPFVPWLLPESLREWVTIERQWEGKSSLAEVLRSERKTN